MSKRVLAILLAMLMAVGIYSTVANAGVEGDFTLHIIGWPQTTSYEADKFDFDVEALLNLDFTLSGLTFSNDLAMGIAGIEHYIADIQTTLGAMNLYDEFAFAKPYINCNYWYPSKWKGPEVDCTPAGNVLFVKKRVTMEITLGGLTVSNLAIFEDIDFPQPTDTTYTDDDASGYYDQPDQRFRFGDIITVSGTTVSGIEVTTKTGICADFDIYGGVYLWDILGKWGVYKVLESAPDNVIKKKKWSESVCENEKLEFTKEYIAVTGVTPMSGLTFNVHTIFNPSLAAPFTNFFGAVEAVYTLPMNLGTAYVWLDFLQPKDLVFETPFPLVALTLGHGLQIVWQDLNASLGVDAGDYLLSTLLLQFQNVTMQNWLWSIVGTGMYYMHNEVDIPISYPEPIGTLTIDAYWYDADEDGNLEFEDIDFGVTKQFGEHNEFSFDAAFNEDGMYGVDFAITVLFSL